MNCECDGDEECFECFDTLQKVSNRNVFVVYPFLYNPYRDPHSSRLEKDCGCIGEEECDECFFDPEQEDEVNGIPSPTTILYEGPLILSLNSNGECATYRTEKYRSMDRSDRNKEVDHLISFFTSSFVKTPEESAELDSNLFLVQELHLSNISLGRESLEVLSNALPLMSNLRKIHIFTDEPIEGPSVKSFRDTLTSLPLLKEKVIDNSASFPSDRTTKRLRIE